MEKYTFTVLVRNGDKETIEERYYSDISYVNFWTNSKGNPIYKVYMMNGESLFVADNQNFCRACVPKRVNAIGEVRRKKYLLEERG